MGFNLVFKGLSVITVLAVSGWDKTVYYTADIEDM
jgi:hypothetical protein